MAKVKFEFDLYEDRDELKLYKAVDRMYFALDMIYNLVRQELKHGSEPLSDHVVEFLTRVKIEAGLIHNLDGE